MIPKTATDFAFSLLDWLDVYIAYYPRHLIGCLIVWALMVWLLPVNRASAFVFAFSAWFALLWAVPVGAVVYDAWPEMPPKAFILLAMFMTPPLLFGYCAISSATVLGAPHDSAVDDKRLVRWFWFFAPATLLHLFFLLMLEGLRDS